MAASPLQPLLAIAVRGAPAEPPDARREGEEEGGGDGALTGVDAGDGAAVAACAAPPPVELCFRAAAVAGPAAAHMASIERARRPGAMARFAWRRVLCVLRARGLGCLRGFTEQGRIFAYRTAFCLAACFSVLAYHWHCDGKVIYIIRNFPSRGSALVLTLDGCLSVILRADGAG